jgi:hypothetical protein
MRGLGLNEMLWPTSIAEFTRTYFETAPLHLSRGETDYFANLFCLEDVDRFLYFAKPSYTKAFAIDSRRKIEPAEYADANGLADPRRLCQLYEAGATIVLREIEGHFPRLEALCRSAEKHFNSPFVATVYWAPPQGQSFPIHFDAKDVFVLQIAGSKSWRLYQPRYLLPLSHQHCYDGMPDEGFLDDFDLRAGDSLYCPRGFPHLVRAADSPSLHISLSTFPHTWADVMSRVMADLCERDPLFRASLPPAFIGSDAGVQETFAALVKRFAETARLRPALDALTREFVASRPARLEDPRRRHHRATTLSLESLIESNPDALYMIEPDHCAVRLTGLGKDIKFDASALDDLVFALETPRYKISETPGALEPDAKLDLFQTLVLHGFVDVA